MKSSLFSRRAWLWSAAAAIGCGPPKAKGYPGYCFIANQRSRSLAVVDLNTFRRWPAIPLDAAPASVLAHSAGRKAFVLAPQGGVIYEIDAASRSISRRVRAGNQAVAMRLAPAGDALWVLMRDPAGLAEIPLDTFRPRRRIRLGAAPDDFDLSSDGRAAVVSRAARSVSLVSLQKAAVEQTAAASVELTAARFRPDGKQVLAASRPDRSITIFDTGSGKTVVRLPLPLEPQYFCYDSAGGQLFVTGDGMDAVVILYPYSTEVAETVLAGRAPAGMAVQDSFLFVANPTANTVTVLDIDYRQLASVIQVGLEPRQILITPDKQYALVLNEKSGDLAVIRFYSLTESVARRYKSAALFTLIPVGEKPVSAAVVSL